MKNKKVLLLTVLILSAFVLPAFVSCGGGGESVKKETVSSAKNRGTETGYATIFDGDSALAKDRALDDAKNKLVKKILGETVSGTSVMKDFELVSSIVEARSTGLVKDVNILKRWEEGNQLYLTIEGTVELAAVNDAIEAAINNYGRPKFMVLVEETFDGKSNKPGFTETETIMQELMGDSGFQFVDAGTIQALMKKEKTKMDKALQGSVTDGAVQQLLLDSAGAEVLILGTAQTNDQSATLSSYGAQNMKSKSAIINIKAIDVFTGNILASMSRNAPGMHIEPTTASKKAIENALAQIVGKTNRDSGKFETGKFINTIAEKFIKSTTEREMKLIISGLDYTGGRNFQNTISQRVRGVSKVESKGQSGTTTNLTVYFAGKTNDFVDELMAKADNFGYKIQVKEVFPNRILLSVKKI